MRNIKNRLRFTHHRRARRLSLALALVLVSVRLFSGVKDCPTTDEVLSSVGKVGTISLITQAWGDTFCSSGCVLRDCASTKTPCCVVKRSTGWNNLFQLICTRQVDNYLYSQKRKYGTNRLVQYCNEYLALQLRSPPCTNATSKVPWILHTTNYDDTISRGAQNAVLFDPSLRLIHSNDTESYDFIRKHCSRRAAEAYACIRPAAFRADLYRFCALYAMGGIYMDSDIIPLVPLKHIVSTCSSFTLGYDQAQTVYDIKHIGMQMKILASEPGHAISSCMMNNIIENVVHRRKFKSRILAFSGPQLLRRCYLEHSRDVAITYIDTRGADWPYTGLRASNEIYAYEAPSSSRHFKEIAGRDAASEYAIMMKNGHLYTESCQL